MFRFSSGSPYLYINISTGAPKNISHIIDICIVHWGHRHQLRTALEEINTDIGNDENCFENEKVKNKEAYCFRKENNTTEVDKAEYVDITSPETIADDSEYNKYAYNNIPAKKCSLCLEESQHMCRICGKLVCVLLCSLQDP